MFVHPGLLHRAEALRSLESDTSRLSISDVLRQDGKWFPGFDLPARSSLRPLPRTIEGSRQRRRNYKREVDAAIQAHTARLFKLDAYIDRSHLKQQVEALFYGEITEAEFNLQAERAFYDPENVILRMGKAKTLSKMRQEIDSFGAMFTQAYRSLGELTIELAERAAAARASYAGARAFALQIIRDKLFLGLCDVRRHYFRRLIKREDLNDPTVDRALMRCPGITILFQYLDLQMLNIFDSILDGKETKRSNNPDRFNSDGGDALHLSYLPYVDCFRCDRDTSIALAKIGAPEGKVFKSAQDLINHLISPSEH